MYRCEQPGWSIGCTGTKGLDGALQIPVRRAWVQPARMECVIRHCQRSVGIEESSSMRNQDSNRRLCDGCTRADGYGRELACVGVKLESIDRS